VPCGHTHPLNYKCNIIYSQMFAKVKVVTARSSTENNITAASKDVISTNWKLCCLCQKDDDSPLLHICGPSNSRDSTKLIGINPWP